MDRLLNLPIPSSSTSLSRSGGLPTLQEEGDEEQEEGEEDTVALLQGFSATIPSAQSRKLARRRRRAVLSEKQLGITIGVNELGLKERGNRARGLLSADIGDGQYTVDSIEQTPKKRVVKSKRRSSFMPTPLRDASRSSSLTSHDAKLHPGTIISEENLHERQSTIEEGEEHLEFLTKPELEEEIKEIKLDKTALNVRRKLTMKDLEVIEEKIRKLELMKDDLGNRLLVLKEEELELDDERKCLFSVLLHNWAL